MFCFLVFPPLLYSTMSGQGYYRNFRPRPTSSSDSALGRVPNIPRCPEEVDVTSMLSDADGVLKSVNRVSSKDQFMRGNSHVSIA